MSKVSIITASYNYENYIKATIESVLNQTFSDWELIIVDDGSKDNSLEVIKSYCQKDNRIKLFQHENGENRGLAQTLKIGIANSSSKWIAFLESDDTITPNYLEEKLKIAEKYEDVDFIFNNVHMFGDEEIINSYNKIFFEPVFSEVKTIQYPSKLLKIFQKYHTQTNLIPTFSAVMMKKELAVSLDFNSPFMPWLDWYLWMQCVAQNTNFYCLDKKLTNWRMHKNSFISTKLSEDERFLFDIKKYLLLFRYKNIFLILPRAIKHFRRKIIRIHFREGEIILFGRVFPIKFLQKNRC